MKIRWSDPLRSGTCVQHSLQQDRAFHDHPLARHNAVRDDAAPATLPAERHLAPRVTSRRFLNQHAMFLAAEDRKSTRLNSSHRCISYAVFCLKKKIKKHNDNRNTTT